MSYTLAEVAEKTGKSQVNLRKMIERGQLASEKEGGRTVITDEALENLLGGQTLHQAADVVTAGRTHEVGNIIARLPNRIASAILEGMPTSKKPAGDPSKFRDAAAKAPRNPTPYPDLSDDPHYGFEVGHRHQDAPRWHRKTKSTWTLGDAGYEWNGFLWEGRGSRAGTSLAEGISPAHPDAAFRPLTPSPSAAK